ncbi:EAL domain-containing protein [Synechococcus sp. RSCCF101]|uniref:sensor domain-containing protein n=1 Tax=Synechococcus sp. RSCCF101 TaxID=2511069 RepID=UPI0012465E0F|nr:EAL domain-containing protein [Synechococcus sp. RSCCF101]QEY31259.1 EAL domain-containing protein [Synechococcus sp. RSCCF101]
MQDRAEVYSDSLQEAEHRFRRFANGIPGAIFQYVLNTDGTDTVSYMSKGCIDLWEIPASDVVDDASALSSQVLADDVKGLAESVQRSADTLEFWRHEWRMRTPSGQIKWVSGTGTPRRLADGGTAWDSVIIDVTRERQDQLALNQFFEQANTLNLITDLDWRIQRANPAWARVLGLQPAALLGRAATDLIDPIDRTLFLERFRSCQREGTTMELDCRVRDAGGALHQLTWSAEARVEHDLIFIVARDVTRARQDQRRLQQAAAVFESTAEGVIITDLNGSILDVNDAFSRVTGYSREEVIGRNPNLLRSGRHDARFYEAMWQEVQQQGHWHGEIWNRSKDGAIFPELLTISTVVDEAEQPSGYVGVFSDISLLKQHQERLNHLAHHDPLTDLPNRTLFTSRLQHSIERCRRAGSSLAVLFIDLDRFKHINDSLGHSTGDELLIEITARIRQRVRASDTLARISGDEFVVLLENVSSREAARAVVDDLLAAFQHPYTVNGISISITASMGLSFYPADGADVSSLLANADAAMYKAKDEGRNTVLFYSSEFTAEAFEHVFLETGLKQALDRQELFLVYQPQFDLQSRRVSGMEALLRWRHPQNGVIAPSRFIPFAERSGLIRPIGRWVLEQACRDGRAWLEAGLAIGHMAVNVATPELLRSSFAEDLAMVVSATGFPADQLEIEITESSIMKQPDRSIAQLDQVRATGVMVSVDDFGTGYSSLGMLKKLPINRLKLDQSFVRDLPDDPDDIAIAEAIISLGHAMNLEIIAEGIERTEQEAFLRQRGCHLGQGHWFSRPLPAEAIPEFMASHR